VLSCFLSLLASGRGLSFIFLFMSALGASFGLLLSVSLVKSHGRALVNFYRYSLCKIGPLG
jgi:hypothetical protein